MMTIDWVVVAESLTEFGALGVVVLVLGVWFHQEMNKRDKLNQDRIGDLKEDIRIVRTENKEEKELFRGSIQSFNRALDELSGFKRQVSNLETDIAYIKKNIEK